MDDRNDVTPNCQRINLFSFDAWFRGLPMIEDDVVAFRGSFRLEVGSELLLAGLIRFLALPNFRFHDMLVAGAENHQVCAPASCLNL